MLQGCGRSWECFFNDSVLLREISGQEPKEGKAGGNRRVSNAAASHRKYEKRLHPAGEHLLMSVLALRPKHHFLLLEAHFHVHIKNNICQILWKQTLVQ